MTKIKDWPSVNKSSLPLVEDLIKNSTNFKIGISKGPLGCKIVDCGINYAGGIKAGILITKICMGGLGEVDLAPTTTFKKWNWSINVYSSNPTLACLGSQYAGWNLSSKKFYSLGSGPARSLAYREKLFKELGYKDRANKSSLVLEVDQVPPKEIISKIAKDCKILPSNLVIILTPTTSLAGNLQIVGRVLEVAMHKIHELGFPLEKIVDGFGQAPIPPPGSNFIEGMGRTNDAIIYGGNVHLFVSGLEKDIKDLAKNLPSRNSKDYGKPFAKIFKSYKSDFYSIDGSLFSPARVTITSLQTGKSFSCGEINEKLINASFSSKA